MIFGIIDKTKNGKLFYNGKKQKQCLVLSIIPNIITENGAFVWWNKASIAASELVTSFMDDPLNVNEREIKRERAQIIGNKELFGHRKIVQ